MGSDVCTLAIQLVVLFGRCRKCGLVGGSMLLEMGFESLKTCGIPSALSLFCICGPRRDA